MRFAIWRAPLFAGRLFERCENRGAFDWLIVTYAPPRPRPLILLHGRGRRACVADMVAVDYSVREAPVLCQCPCGEPAVLCVGPVRGSGSPCPRRARCAHAWQLLARRSASPGCTFLSHYRNIRRGGRYSAAPELDPARTGHGPTRHSRAAATGGDARVRRAAWPPGPPGGHGSRGDPSRGSGRAHRRAASTVHRSGSCAVRATASGRRSCRSGGGGADRRAGRAGAPPARSARWVPRWPCGAVRGSAAVPTPCRVSASRMASRRRRACSAYYPGTEPVTKRYKRHLAYMTT